MDYSKYIGRRAKHHNAIWECVALCRDKDDGKKMLIFRVSRLVWGLLDGKYLLSKADVLNGTVAEGEHYTHIWTDQIEEHNLEWEEDPPPPKAPAPPVKEYDLRPRVYDPEWDMDPVAVFCRYFRPTRGYKTPEGGSQ